MDNRIDEITRKIYNEGVIKAKEDAEKVLSDARLQAEKIIKEAHNEHAQLIAQSQQEAKEVKHKTESELKLAGHQFISNLKQQITELITTKQVNKPIENALNDVDFLQKTILAVIKKWDGENIGELEILLPDTYRKEMDAFFHSKAIEALNKEVVFRYDKRVGSGFKIGPKNGGYLISFTEKDFINYFKNYLKENTKKLLFDTTE